MFGYSLLIGLSAIFLAGFSAWKVISRQIQNQEMAQVASYIQTGASAYLKRQTRTILSLSPILFIILYLILGWEVALTSLFGVFTSLAAAYVGMSICVRANLQTADISSESPKEAFQTAVFGGSVMGLCITGFSISILSLFFMIFRRPELVVGFGFGASLAALFAQIGGGIFTKSADIGADLVGKVEKGIPEDDPRNAAVVADLVGDNVGDCAGRGADLFESFSDDIITGSIVALLFIPKYGPKVIFFPLLLQSVGIIASSLGIFSTKFLKKNFNPSHTFILGLGISSLFSILGSFCLCKLLLNDLIIWLASVLGVVVTLVSATVTRHYAGMDGYPVKCIAQASKRGAALNLITAISYGLRSPIIPIMMIILAIIGSYKISGGILLAISAANIGTDLLIAYIMASDAFGPIVDNAAGIAEMSKAPKKVVDSLSSLDSVGNTMKAITKAYSMSSGTVTAFVIFATFFSLTKINFLTVGDPFLIGFLFLGVTLPYLIASLTIGSAAKTALQIVDEVRRQFREIKGLFEGKTTPDYAKCVDIATKNAIREMVLPGVISIALPMAVGLLFGAGPLGALLIGAVASAALLGPFLNNTGTALDNAKKLIENNNQKGTFEHAAAVVGDTVGDPFKDVAGPSLLIFMKLVGMSALLVAPLLH